MTFRKLTNISFPSQILAIDKRNSLVCLLVGLMVFVCIESRFRRPVGSLWTFLFNFIFYFLLFDMSLISFLLSCALRLYLGLLNWLCCDFVLCSDDCDFDRIRLCFDRNSLLHLVVRLLLCVETADLVVIHAVLLLADGRNGLHEAYHSLVALGVEFAVIAGLDAVKLLRTVCLRQRRYLWLDSVLEVGQETETVFQLDFERLIIDSGPRAYEVLLRAVDSVLAEDGFDLEFVH